MRWLEDMSQIMGILRRKTASGAGDSVLERICRGQAVARLTVPFVTDKSRHFDSL
jgi:hypothetical protein